MNKVVKIVHVNGHMHWEWRDNADWGLTWAEEAAVEEGAETLAAG